MQANEVRIEAARELFKGQGYLSLFSNITWRTPEQTAAARIVFGSPRGNDVTVYRAIHSAVKGIPNEATRAIVQSAMGGHKQTKFRSLADRRRRIAEILGISERTVFRQEDRGLELVFMQLDELNALDDVSNDMSPAVRAAALLQDEERDQLRRQIAGVVRELDTLGSGDEADRAKETMLYEFVTGLDYFSWDNGDAVTPST